MLKTRSLTCLIEVGLVSFGMVLVVVIKLVISNVVGDDRVVDLVVVSTEVVDIIVVSIEVTFIDIN